ncbi:hypothetical protein C0989_008797 [Termitomyces sp. Mn162]|nr:hypothetical protein C0989_008797 [Termitomyces sp. Mn162]
MEGLAEILADRYEVPCNEDALAKEVVGSVWGVADHLEGGNSLSRVATCLLLQPRGRGDASCRQPVLAHEGHNVFCIGGVKDPSAGGEANDQAEGLIDDPR